MTEKNLEIAFDAVKDDLTEQLNSVNFSSWLQLVSLVCNSVEKRKELSGEQKKEIAVKTLKHFVNGVGFDNDVIKVIINTTGDLVDEVIAVSKGIYELNNVVKKSGIFAKLCPCIGKKKTGEKTKKNEKKTEEKTPDAVPEEPQKEESEKVDEIREEPTENKV
jgi:hypothetical protein